MKNLEKFYALKGNSIYETGSGRELMQFIDEDNITISKIALFNF